MAGQPNLSIWVNLGHIGIQIDGSPIIPVFIEKSLNDAGQVARVRRRLAVAHLPPQIRASLAAATTEIKIVVDLIIRRGASPIKQRGRGPLQRNDYRAVCFISVYVTPQAITLPSKARRIIKPAVDILPISSSRFLDIVVQRHLRKRQDGFLVCDIWA